MNLNNCFILILSTIAVISNGKINSIENQYKVEGNQLQLIRLIKDLNEQLYIEWNAVVALKISQDLENVLKSLKRPVFIMTKKFDLEINNLHRHQMLTIVFLDFSTFDLVYDIVKGLLRSSQSNHILWIYPEAELKDLGDLAKINWNSGFTKVLYYVKGQLYTYDPVPSIKIREIFRLQDYLERKEIIDFQGHQLTVPIEALPPRCYRYKDKFGNIINTGYLYKVLRVFIEYYNFQFKKFPINYGSLNFEALTQGVYNKTIDIVPASLITYDRLAGDKSDTLWIIKTFIMAPYPDPIPKSKYLLRLFNPITTICAVALFLFCALAVAFSNYLQCSNGDFSKSLLYVFSLTLYQSHLKFKIKTNLQKLTFCLIILYGFIMTNLFLAKLSSLLVENVYEPKLEKFEDIKKTNLKLLLRPLDYNYMQTLHNVPPFLKQRIVLTDNTALYKAHRDLNNTHLLLAFEDKIDFLLFQQRFLKVPRMYKINDILHTVPEYFTVRKDLPYLQLFNRYLKYIIESGILHKFVVDTNFDGIISGEIRFLQDLESSDGLYLSFEYFSTTLEMFAFGMILSLGILMLELMYFKFTKK